MIAKKVKQQEEYNSTNRATLQDASLKPESSRTTNSEASASEVPPRHPPPQAPRPSIVTNYGPNYGPQYTQPLLTLYNQDPNGPLIYDMMANRSSRWRAKNMRSSILPPGWKMGISRLGRVPVYDPLYPAMPPPRAPIVRDAVISRSRDPHTGMIRRMTMDEGVAPRYQATDAQYDHDLDQHHLGLPPNLAALHHDWKHGRGGGYGGGGGGGIRRGGGPWIPPNLRGGGGVPVVVEDLLEDDLLGEAILEPRDILHRPVVPRRSTFPPQGPHHRSAHIPPHHRGHPHTRDIPNYTVRRYIREDDGIGREFENVALHNEVDREAVQIAALQDQMDLQDAARREEHERLRDREARLRHERAARAAAEQELRIREQQLAASEAERVAEELAHHGHAHGRLGHGHHRPLHPRHVEHRGPRIAGDLHGREVVVDEHPHHRELVHIPRDVIDPHHRHHENITHVGHHSPPHRLPARHVHFADDFTSSEEGRLERHRQRLHQEAHPMRRRFDRDGRPYLFHEDELDYAREEFGDDEIYDSSDEYYLPHQRLLMPPRVVRGNYWDEYADTDDD